MFVGFDYGSANCSIGYMENDTVKMMPLTDNGNYIMSTLYAMDRELISEAVYRNLPDDQKADYAKLRASQLRRAKAARHELDLEPNEQAVFIGEAAFNHYLDMPEEGFYVRSPKSFLGAKGLRPDQIALFEDIVTVMMQRVKQQAEKKLKATITHAVIGRPVNFQAIGGEESNLQAEAILSIAAKRAGFEAVEFLFEPIAAGMDFEASLDCEKSVLVVDVGGGTTDCSLIKMSPERLMETNRNSDCLGHSGQRIGGNDIDISLAMQGLMPEFGSESLLNNSRKIPQQPFWNAVAINDISAQREFAALSCKTLLADLMKDTDSPEKLSRLQYVQEHRLSYQIVKCAESAKISLSDRDNHSVELGFIEQKLNVDLSLATFVQAIESPISKIENLMRLAVEKAQCEPDIIYVTGGTARSPAIHDRIKQVYPNIEIIVGDHFGSVTAGLARWAQRVF
ncbi:molecular chaperone [Parashewanella tropica]|uniref:molecular chaperone n=1 Tax=Parashewanella tropica TaxID=2547970 RepID=UPI0010594A0B|nr:molecular chaperone [Parashewanella tropica]